MAKIALDPGPFVFPMPALLIGAESDGRPNFMTAAFCGIVNFKPVIVGCGLNPAHQTCKGIEQHGAFTINVPSVGQVEVTDWCGLNSGSKVDKSVEFDVFRGETGHAPMIRECALNAECRLLKTIPFEADTLYLGEVVRIHAEKTVLTDGKPDWKKLRPLIFTFPEPSYWQLGDRVGTAWSIGKKYEPKGT